MKNTLKSLAQGSALCSCSALHSLKWLARCAALCLLAFSCTQKPAPSATLLLLNGHFWTADSLQPQATALAIQADRILYVGDEAGAKALAGPNTQIVDLKGAFAMPGLIEGHGHFLGLGNSQQELNFLHSSTWAEIVQMCAQKAAQTPKGAWIQGRGWHQEKWTELPGPSVNGYPYHDALSQLTPDNPVVLKHASGHALMANARAIELAGITGEMPDPVGGRIVRDAAGKLTGVFEENAMDLILAPLEKWENTRSEAEKVADFEKTVEAASQACLKNGITSFQDAGSSFWEIEHYKRMAEESRLKLRLWAMIAQPKMSDLDKLDNFPQIGIGKGYFTVRAVKAYLDGALGSYGAWLLAPYNDKPGFFGQNVTPLDTLVAIAARCRDRNLQFCVHAIGDRGNRETLDIFEKYAPKGARWRIEHAQHLDGADIPRFSQLGVIASMQAIHCTSDAPFVIKRLGADRARIGAYAWRSLLASGAHMANGTDTPVEELDPMANLYASVTRKRPDSGLEFFTGQALSREEALFAYTLWNAFAAFEENDKGSLQQGKLADITVFSKDLLHCALEEILSTKVIYTIVGGEIKYQ